MPCFLEFGHLFQSCSIQPRQRNMFRISLVAVLLLVSAVGNTQARPDQASLADKSAAVSKPSGEYDPLLDLPPLRSDKISLIGGTVTRLDRVQDQLILQPFGDKKQMRLAFDVRTRFYRDGQRTSGHQINQGQRVYANTLLNGKRPVANSMRINNRTQS